MKPRFKLVLTLLTLVLFACQQKENTKKVLVETPLEQAPATEFPAVSLNEGKMWEANAETTEGIVKMYQMIDDFSIEEENSEALITELKAEFTMIFQKCTMTGEAHEQLHNYLLPLKVKIDKFSKESTAENLDDVKKYLKEYGYFFK